MRTTRTSWVAAAVVGAAGALAMAAPADAQTELSFALHTSPPGPEFEAVDKFAELVESRSEGRITVRTYPAAVLGGERDNIEQLTVGEVAMTLNGDLLPNLLTPEYAATVVPFVFPNPEEVFAFWDSPIGEEAKQTIEERGGIIVAGFMRRGDRHLTAKRAVETPDDMQGMKLRVPEIQSWVTAWSAVGARPTPVAWPEVFNALQMGVVDGQENPCFNIHQAKLYEVQDYLIYTGHLPAVWHWSVSKQFLDGLSEEDRQIVLDAVAEAAAYGDEVTKEQIDTTCRMLEEEFGMEAIQPDRDAFWAQARPAIEEMAQSWAPGVLDAVQKYFE